MNCDDVFRILTQGPFPCGDPSDHQVEKHLATCADCRRLAEALQPAIELNEEAVTPEESSDLPAYWGELFHPSFEIPEPPAPTQTAVGRSRLRLPAVPRIATRARLTTASGFVGATMLGLLLGLALRGAGPAPDGHSIRDRLVQQPGRIGTANTGVLGVATSPDENGNFLYCVRAQAPSEGAPIVPISSCATSTSIERLAAESELNEWSHVRCCTQCHHAAGSATGTGTKTTGQIISTCGNWHAD